MPILSPSQKDQLIPILLSAFPQRVQMEAALSIHLGVTFDAFATTGAYTTDLVYLLDAANGIWMGRLLDAFRKANPGNQALNTFLADYDLTSAALANEPREVPIHFRGSGRDMESKYRLDSGEHIEITHEPKKLARQHPFINMAEHPPAYFVHRPEETEKLLAALLPKSGSPLRIKVALHGPGGTGKTSLAQHICQTPEIRAAYPDGILWVTLGNNPQVLKGLTALYAALTGERPSFVNEEDAASSLGVALEGKRCLINIDDAWSQDHVRPFLHGGDSSTRLITTQKFDTLPLDVTVVEIGSMQLAEAIALLSTNLVLSEHLDIVQKLAVRLGRWPLLLNLVNGTLRNRVQRHGQSIEKALEYVSHALDRLGPEAFDVPGAKLREQAVKITLDLSFNQLSKAERDRFNEVVVFPADTDIPISTINRLWNYTARFDNFETERLCERLNNLSLLSRFDLEHNFIRMHDILRSYLMNAQKAVISNLHERLISAYQMSTNLQMGNMNIPWHTGPDDGYYYQTLAYHLVNAGMSNELYHLLMNFNWLKKRLEVTEINGLLSDYRLFFRHQDSDPAPIHTIYDTLLLSAYVLALNKSQLASQLFGRLQSDGSPEIQKFLVGCSDNQNATWLKPHAAYLKPPGGPLDRTLFGHFYEIDSIILTPDGNRLISASRDGVIKAWDLTSGSELWFLRGYPRERIKVVTPKSGTGMLVSTSVKKIIFRDLNNGSFIFALNKSYIYAIVSLNDNRHILTSSKDGSLLIWDLETKKYVVMSRSADQTDSVTAMSLTSGGDSAVTATKIGFLRIWDLQMGHTYQNMKDRHYGYVWKIVITPDDRYAISASSDKTLKVWDLNSRQLVHSLEGHDGAVYDVAVLANGKQVISASEDYTLKIWDLKSGTDIHTLFGHSSIVSAVDVTSDGKFAVSASHDRTLKIWNLEKIQPQQNQQHKITIYDIKTTSDGKNVITASADKTIKIWDVDHNKEIRTLKGHGGAVRALAISPDNQWIISGGGSFYKDKSIRVWELTTGKVKFVLRGHTSRINSLAISPDGKYIASASEDRSVKVWDFVNGSVMHTLKGHTAAVRAVSFTPDGMRLVTGSTDKTLRVWDLIEGKQLSVLVGHHSEIRTLAVTPNGKFAISGGREYLIKVWDLTHGVEVFNLEGHFHWINNLAISPNGEFIISASRDSSVRVWSLELRSEIARFTLESQQRACGMTPDGKTVIVGDNYGHIFYFDLIVNETH